MGIYPIPIAPPVFLSLEAYPALELLNIIHDTNRVGGISEGARAQYRKLVAWRFVRVWGGRPDGRFADPFPLYGWASPMLLRRGLISGCMGLIWGVIANRF